LEGIANRTHGPNSHLYLDQSSLPVLQLINRQQHFSSSGSLSLVFDVQSLFPHLILLTVIKDMQKPLELQVSVFRPIGLATLLQVCNAWTSASDTGIISLFARYFFLSESPPPGDCPHSMSSKNITELRIAPGACISRSFDIRCGMPSLPVRDLYYHADVHIEGDEITEGIKETLRTIFECPSEEFESTFRRSHHPWPSFYLKCSASVLECIIETVSFGSDTPNQLIDFPNQIGATRAPPWFNYTIFLSGLASREAMECHTVAFAKAYCSHWTYHIGSDGYTTGYPRSFSEIISAAAPGKFILDDTVAFSAQVYLGWDDEAAVDDILRD
jgi:hypothetical protein